MIYHNSEEYGLKWKAKQKNRHVIDFTLTPDKFHLKNFQTHETNEQITQNTQIISYYMHKMEPPFSWPVSSAIRPNLNYTHKHNNWYTYLLNGLWTLEKFCASMANNVSYVYMIAWSAIQMAIWFLHKIANQRGNNTHTSYK